MGTGKIKFPKKTVELSPVDLEMADAELYKEVKITFWDNPSRTTVRGLFKLVSAAGDFLKGMSNDELRQLEKEFYASVSQIVVDTNIEGISFDTPEEAMAAFEADHLPMGFMHEAVTNYVIYMFKYNEKVKKALGLFLLASPTGTGKPKEEQQ